jgi:hypothetical protein
MSSVVSPKLRRLVRDLGKQVIQHFAGRESWSRTEYVRLLFDELGKYDLNHSDFRSDIARAFVAADLAERCKHDPFTAMTEQGAIDVTLLKPEDFAKGVIRLGNGMNVRMADATSRQWIARQLHQQRAAEASQHAATRTTMFLQTEPGVMLIENPRLKTQEAMCQLSLWEFDAVREDEDDDDTNDEE